MAGSLFRKWLNGNIERSTASPVAIEPLEVRRLLSASLGTAAPVVATPAAATVTPAVQTFGVTLHLQAGQPFDGYLGTVTGAHVDTTTDKVSASINWGDDSQTSKAVVSIGASGHIDVGGAHTYSADGDYSISITVSAAPIPVPGQPTSTHVLLLGTIKSAADVAGTSMPGVEIAETANVPFTATVGSFQFAAPAQGLSATINWGDGTSTAATLKASGSTGLVRFAVDGTHTYAKPGEYAIHIVVSQKAGATSQKIASISSKAVVTTAITGTYKVSTSMADAGATYQFTGTGITGNLPLTITGSVTLPGLVASGSAAGKLTLKTPEGSVTFTVTGPAEKGFGPFPTTLKFVVSGGTGTYAGSTGSGMIAVTLNTASKSFAFTLEDVTSVAL